MKKAIKIILIFFITVCILAIGAVVFSQIYVKSQSENYIKTDIGELPEADAVLVLGARVYSDGTPSPLLKDRLDYGYEIYKIGKAKKILVSGDHGKKEYNEVKAMKQYLLDKQVPEEDIFMDHAGFDTYDSIYRARDVFCIKSIIISTQKYHMYRAVYIGQKLGLDAYGYPCEDKSEYNMMRNNVREALARVKAIIDIEILKSEPKFLGEQIPITGDGRLTSDGE